MHEKKIFDLTDQILNLIGGKPIPVRQIMISETIRKEIGSFSETGGLWEPKTGRIVIKRSALESAERYAGTLLHEVAHAASGSVDVDRNFELELTRMLGVVSVKALDLSKTEDISSEKSDDIDASTT